MGEGVAVGLGVGEAVAVGVGVAVGSGVGVGVSVGDGVGVPVGLGIGESVAVAIGIAVGVAVCVGLGSELGVLSVIRTSGTGEVARPTFLSCPQANADVATARVAARQIVRALNRDSFPIYGLFNYASTEASSHLSTVHDFRYLQLGKAGGAVFLEPLVELVNGHAKGSIERLLPGRTGLGQRVVIDQGFLARI